MILLTLKHELQPPPTQPPQEKPDPNKVEVSKSQAQESKGPAAPKAGAAPAGTEYKECKEYKGPAAPKAGAAPAGTEYKEYKEYKEVKAAAAAEQIDGTYAVIEAAASDGRPETAADMKKWEVTIKGGRIAIATGGGKRGEMVFTLDPSAEPGRIEYKPVPPTVWADETLRVTGIYRVTKTELGGLELTIAVSVVRGERPDRFDGKKPGEQVIRLLRFGALY